MDWRARTETKNVIYESEAGARRTASPPLGNHLQHACRGETVSSIACVYVDEQKTEQTKTSNAAGYARSRSAQRDQMTEATRRTDMSDKGIAEERNILRTGSVNSATKVKTFETPLGLKQNAQ